MIRPATPADVPAILALIRELAGYEKLSHACIATEPLLQKHLFGEDKAADALVTEIQIDSSPQTVGYAIYFKTFSTFLARPGLYLEDIYVQPPHRRKGLGKAMLKHLANFCIEKNYPRLEWTCLDWNQRAQSVYESLGANHMSEWYLYRLTQPDIARLAAELD